MNKVETPKVRGFNVMSMLDSGEWETALTLFHSNIDKAELLARENVDACGTADPETARDEMLLDYMSMLLNDVEPMFRRISAKLHKIEEAEKMVDSLLAEFNQAIEANVNTQDTEVRFTHDALCEVAERLNKISESLSSAI